MGKDKDQKLAEKKVEEKKPSLWSRLIRNDKVQLGAGMCATALATFIFFPLAIPFGAAVGGMVGNKMAKRHETPATTRLGKIANFMRRVVAIGIGALTGAVVVTGCTYLGGFLGPVGAVGGAAVGAGLTYKASQKLTGMYAAHEAEKDAGKHPQAPSKEQQHGKEKAKTLAEFLEGVDLSSSVDKQDVSKRPLHEQLAAHGKGYVDQAQDAAERKRRAAELDAAVKTVSKAPSAAQGLKMVKEASAKTALPKKAHTNTHIR